MAHVIIDPGHGGTVSVGGSSPHGVNALEKELNLEVSRRVVARLGGAARLTRDRDINLSLRERASRATGARALISIHTDPSVRGGEVWIHDRHGGASKELAEAVHAGLEQAGPTRGVMRGPLTVLDPTYCGQTAACLIELDGRSTSPSSLDRTADAIAGGVRRYMARYGDGDPISVREVSSPDGLNQRYQGDQNIAYVPFYGYMSAQHDYTNRFIWLVWPQRRDPNVVANVDIDVRFELYTADPQIVTGVTPIDVQLRRVQLAENQRFGYEYSRLTPNTDYWLKVTIVEYSQDAAAMMWINGYC
ncbi:MAG: N-acetylmuramoyl-L-alanine amidase [Kofleriaceae bacterium]